MHSHPTLLSRQKPRLPPFPLEPVLCYTSYSRVEDTWVKIVSLLGFLPFPILLPTLPFWEPLLRDHFHKISYDGLWVNVCSSQIPVIYACVPLQWSLHLISIFRVESESERKNGKTGTIRGGNMFFLMIKRNVMKLDLYRLLHEWRNLSHSLESRQELCC